VRRSQILFALLVLILGAGEAFSKVDPRYSEVAAVISGSPSGAALPSCGAQPGATGDRAAGFRVVVRDVNGSPQYARQVTLHFSQTAIVLLGDDRTGTTIDCAARTITRLTDREGVATFTPRFCGHCAEPRVLVSADGVLLREVPARSTDIDGDGTTGLFDFARVGRNFLTGDPDPATDFDPCVAGSEGRTTLVDLAVFAQELLLGARGTACP
jgi:hypothetical protein